MLPLEKEAYLCLTAQQAQWFRVVPLGLNPGRVVSDQPLSLMARDFLEQKMQSSVQVITVDSHIFEPELKRYLRLRSAVEQAQHEGGMATLVELLLSEAWDLGASDLRCEAFESHTQVRIRVDGELRLLAVLPTHQSSALISAYKAMLGMDIAQRRRPQDGRGSWNMNGKSLDLRASSLPTLWGESLALRLLRREGRFSLEQLGADEPTQQLLRSWASMASGMILSVGPTGSGKTTTQSALLQLIDRRRRNVMTLEDPVEYYLDGVNQVLLNEQAGCDFTSALRSILRQDPDVVVVGEIRDLDSAQLAFRLALTGHLVFSTLHTEDGPSALIRLVEMGLPPYLVCACVRGVLAQRLVRRVQPDGTLQGRFGLFEVMELNLAMAAVLERGEGVDQLRKLAGKAGWKSLRQAGLEQVQLGRTTMEEVMAHTPEDDQWHD